MKRIVKKFSDFSYLREDLENGGMAPSIDDLNQMGSPETAGDDGLEVELEDEETPLSQVGEEIGLAVEKDDRGDFIKASNGDIIRYFSETGYYNETTKKKYGENVSDVIKSIQSAPTTNQSAPTTNQSAPTQFRESRSYRSQTSCKTKSCRTGCKCKRK